MMLEARIVSPTGSLYFSADSTPYDLQTLRTHVREIGVKTHGVRLELGVDDAEWASLQASGWLAQVTSAGVRVSRSRVS